MSVEAGATVYCENPGCRVELYTAGDKEEDMEKHYLSRDGVGVQNCPGCGRMGRTKGDAKNE